MTAQRFRKKPVTIEAMRFNSAEAGARIVEWSDSVLTDADEIVLWYEEEGPVLEIHTPEGVMVAQLGWWVIRGVKGEFYPCDPDIFDLTYEREGSQG